MKQGYSYVFDHPREKAVMGISVKYNHAHESLVVELVQFNSFHPLNQQPIDTNFIINRAIFNRFMSMFYCENTCHSYSRQPVLRDIEFTNFDQFKIVGKRMIRYRSVSCNNLPTDLYWFDSISRRDPSDYGSISPILTTHGGILTVECMLSNWRLPRYPHDHGWGKSRADFDDFGVVEQLAFWPCQRLQNHQNMIKN